MKLSFAISMMLLSTLFLVFAGIQDAEAKRLGGGRSFGAKPGFNSPYKRSVTPRKQTPGQQMTQQKNSQRRADFSRRGGLMGMLGGLAIGGLLGALLFGGAFENLNFFDILIFGLIAFVLYKIFASRKRRLATQAAGGGGYTPAGGGAADGTPHTPRGDDTGYDASPTPSVQGGARSGRIPGMDEAMKRDNSTQGTGVEEVSSGAVDQVSRTELPKDFNKQEFMQGAERAYYMLQDAWDKGDLDAIRGLTTDSVFAEIQAQLSDRHGTNRTDVVKLSADLLEVDRVGSNLEATVLFDAQLRELDDQSNELDQGQHVLEVWHFKRPVDAATPTWFLDGIQQVEQKDQ